MLVSTLNWGGGLLAFCCLLPTLPVVARGSSVANESNPLSVWVSDMLAAADYLGPEHRVAVKADIEAAAKETRRTKDKVLHVVWPQLFKLGSLVYDDLVAWEKLEAVDMKKHAEALDLGMYEPFTEVGLSEAMRGCTNAEERLEQQAARTEYIFHQALRAISLLEQQDLDEVQMKYASLSDFLRELNLYFAKRRGPIHLIQRKAYLEVFATQGDQAAQNHVISLDRELKTLTEALLTQEAALVRAAIKCHEHGLLFKGVITFLKALRGMELA